MKRLLILLLIILMTYGCLVTIGCGGGDESTENTSTVPDNTEDWKTGDITVEQLGVILTRFCRHP